MENSDCLQEDGGRRSKSAPALRKTLAAIVGMI